MPALTSISVQYVYVFTITLVRSNLLLIHRDHLNMACNTKNSSSLTWEKEFKQIKMK